MTRAVAPFPTVAGLRLLAEVSSTFLFAGRSIRATRCDHKHNQARRRLRSRPFYRPFACSKSSAGGNRKLTAKEEGKMGTDPMREVAEGMYVDSWIRKATTFGFAIAAMLVATAGQVQAGIITTFDDGTLSGWSAHGSNTSDNPSPFGGILGIWANGNPRRSMGAIDTVGGGGRLLVIAPNRYTGDYSAYSSFVWDEFVPNHPKVSFPTTVHLRSDDTVFRSKRTMGPLGVWHRRTASFHADDWVREVGAKPFNEVLSNVTHVFINLDVIARAGVVEARVDNIRLTPVPEPTSLAIFVGVGLMGLAHRRRRASVR